MVISCHLPYQRPVYGRSGTLVRADAPEASVTTRRSRRCHNSHYLPPAESRSFVVNRFHRWYCSSRRWDRTVRADLLPWALRGVDLGDDVLEVGPGPGLTTDPLRQQVPRLTAVEIDPLLADRLRTKLGGTVDVVTADATRMPFPDGRFSAAVSFTMLHHLPSPQLQDALLAEVCRVLRPGAVLVGSDSTTGPLFPLAHAFDTMVLVDPEQFAGRLATAGFADPQVQRGRHAFRFRATRPDRDRS